MPLILDDNPYRGINAHLNSVLQNEAGLWKMFHNAHIMHLAEALDAALPPAYEVTLTRSLQILEYHPDTGERIRRSEPDDKPDRPDDDDLYHTALAIRAIEQGQSRLITRLELLSPTNKPPGEGFIQYREKRASTLHQQTPLVEIDYLHQLPPAVRGVPSYVHGQANAYPYTITVTDPRPTLQEGMTAVYGWHVNDPLPLITVPLAADETLVFDMDAVYQRTFNSLRSFRNRADYDQTPPALLTYAETDRQRIAWVMRQVGQGGGG